MIDNPKIRIAGPTCRHVAQGYVCWPVAYHRGQPHASTHCCGREACVEDAARWVEAHTGHRGEFHPFRNDRSTERNQRHGGVGTA